MLHSIKLRIVALVYNDATVTAKLSSCMKV